VSAEESTVEELANLRLAELDAAASNGRARIGWPVLGDAAMYGVAGEIVSALEEHTEADRVALLLSLLVGAGCAIGGGPHVVVGGDRHDTRLNVVLVGETARARKGSSWSMVRPVLYRADHYFVDRRQLSGFGSGEALVDAVRDPRNPDDPDDVGEPDKRLLVVEGEFTRYLRVASRDGSTMSPITRDAWDGVRLAVRSRSGTSIASRPLVAVLGHVVREELRRYLVDSEVAGGFANRFAFALVRRARRLPSGGQLDDELVAHLGDRLRHALTQARRLGRLHRTPDADALWVTMYEALTADEYGLVGAVLARAEAQVLRLSVLFAALDGSRTIEVAHLGAAYELWRYCDASARLIWGDRIGDPIADRLYDALASSHELDGAAQSAVFGRHVAADRLASARDSLVERGIADVVEEPTGGRPRVVLRLANEAKQANQGGVPGVNGCLPSLDSLTSPPTEPLR
jgi:hypothetical protein